MAQCSKCRQEVRVADGDDFDDDDTDLCLDCLNTAVDVARDLLSDLSRCELPKKLSTRIADWLRDHASGR